MPDKLDEIEQRLAKATPGPWVAIEPMSLSGGFPKTKVMHDGGQAIDAITVEDANLIAHAPTDLVYLLRRLKAAEAMADTLKQCAEGAFLIEKRGELINIAKAALTTWQEARDA